MTNATSNDLLRQIREKRAQVQSFIGQAVPRKRRLLNLTIVGGMLAAALTTAPAVGGVTFTSWATKTFGLVAPAWQVLCAGAAACSVMATVATQLLKSQNLEERVTRAQGCRAKLEVLDVGLSIGHLEVGQATTEYLRCLEEATFLEGA
jgi:MFS family permease